MNKNELKDIIKECISEISLEENEKLNNSCEVFIEEAVLNEAKNPERKELVKKISKGLKNFIASEGLVDVFFTCSKLFGNNKKFMKGDSNTILYGINSKSDMLYAGAGYGGNYNSYKDTVKAAADAIKKNNQDCVDSIKEETGRDVSVKVEAGKLGAFNVSVTLK